MLHNRKKLFDKEKLIESELARSLYFKTEKMLYASTNPIISSTVKHYISYKARRYAKLPPQLIHIENTNFCNARCIMCPNSTMQRKKGFMSDTDYKNVVDQIIDLGSEKINLHSIGEPLMDKKFINKVRYAKKFNLKVVTVTNAALLNDNLSKEIIFEGLDEICFSLDAYNKNRYERIRKNLKRDDVYHNIERFVDLKEKSGNNIKVKIRAVFMVNEASDMDDLNNFRKFWRKYPVTLQITNLHNWHNSASIKVNPSSVHGNKVLDNYPCDFLWCEPLITYNLDILPCCHDYEGKLILGNLRNTDFCKIWFENALLNRERYYHLFDREKRSKPCKGCEITPSWFIR